MSNMKEKLPLFVPINFFQYKRGDKRSTRKRTEATDPLKTNQYNETDMLELVLYHVGEMGLYQKLLFLAMLPFCFFYAWVYFGQMFIAITPQNHWCKIPELANLSMELRRNLSAPGATTGDWDHCMTFDTNWTQVIDTLTPPLNGTPMVPCQYGWEFELNDIPYETVVSERDWVCDSASYVPTAQAMFFIGSLVGCAVIGWIADYFGRVPALVVAHLVAGIGGVATIFTSGVWDFIFCRFLVGLAFDSCFMIPYILILEYVGAKHRTFIANMSIALFFGGAAVSLPWIAYSVADWRMFLWITSLPMFSVLLAPWLLPESARWLVSRGRVKQAVNMLRRFEMINGTQIPDDIMDEFIISSNKNRQEKRESFFAVFKSAPLRRTLIFMVLLYMGCAIVFDSLVRLSDSFGLDFFVTFSLTSATEIPAIMLLAIVLDRWGRRNLIWVPLTLAGIFMFIAIFVPKGIAQASLAIVARFFINMCFTSAVQCGTEILPTPFRATGSSALHMCGFVATIFTPFIVYSERFWSSLPLIILVITAFLSAGFGLTMPETKGQAMPQTVADGEKIIREQSLCGRSEDLDNEPYSKCHYQK